MKGRERGESSVVHSPRGSGSDHRSTASKFPPTQPQHWLHAGGFGGGGGADLAGTGRNSGQVVPWLGFKPTTLLLLGGGANHLATVLPD